ncbi:MAG: chorismate mutase [Methanoregula sp.]|jgi:chorismate mutase
MSLEEVRAEITHIDEEIIQLIAQRQALAGKIAAIKQEASVSVHDRQRKNDVLAYVMQVAKEKGIDPAPVKTIFETLIAMNEKQQHAIIGKKSPSGKTSR